MVNIVLETETYMKQEKSEWRAGCRPAHQVQIGIQCLAQEYLNLQSFNHFTTHSTSWDSASPVCGLQWLLTHLGSLPKYSLCILSPGPGGGKRLTVTSPLLFWKVERFSTRITRSGHTKKAEHQEKGGGHLNKDAGTPKKCYMDTSPGLRLSVDSLKWHVQLH